MKNRNLIIGILILVLILVGIFLLVCFREPFQEYDFEITQQDLDRGWYWGLEDQKKIGTPEDWHWVEAGRSSMWRAPEEEIYICPEEETINCMPVIIPERQKYCSGDYYGWIKENCDVQFTY